MGNLVTLSMDIDKYEQIAHDNLVILFAKIKTTGNQENFKLKIVNINSLIKCQYSIIDEG